MIEENFAYFRQAWDEETAFHLARYHAALDWKDRLASAIWLIGERVPLIGAAPSMNFKGLPI